MTPENWQVLMSEFGFNSSIDVYEKLIHAYAEKQRYYHSLKHLEYVLQAFYETKHLAEKPHEVELALWFHDAVYKIFSKDNELNSANWASDFLKQQNANTIQIQTVHQHIMATLHNAPCASNDSALVVDIDLAILGTTADIYNRFEQNVRKEYRLIPGFIYNKKRKEILQSFLDRDSIYQHEYFQDKYESRARENLRKAINFLE